MRTERPCSPTDSVSGLPTSRTMRSIISSFAASSAAAAADRASARASALRPHSRCAARARENAAATVSRSADGALTTTSDWFCGERLSIVSVLMTRRTLALHGCPFRPRLSETGPWRYAAGNPTSVQVAFGCHRYRVAAVDAFQAIVLGIVQGLTEFL